MQENSGRVRWGGMFLAVAMTLAFAGFTIYTFGVPFPVEGQPAQERARELAGASAQLSTTGYVGTVGDVFQILGGLLLLVRAVWDRGALPIAAGWGLVAVGGVVLLLVDVSNVAAFGHLAQAAAFDASLVPLFEGATATADFLFNLGVVVSAAGFAIVLLADARSEARAIPRSLAWVGFVASLLAVIGSFTYLLGVTALGFLVLASYVTFIAVGSLGVRLAIDPEI
ncbi:MAG TPA: hypothetical protein VI997_12520 [Candidatus Thermoplasmatota archaeon]|nr:hypothetical protein [Candidatus Thermoplasmatota archaeon]